MVKNKIVAAPNIDETKLSLRNCLLDLFARIEPRQLNSIWKELVKNCKDYWQIHLEELEEGVEADGSREDSGRSDGRDSRDSSNDESDLNDD